MPNVQQTLNRLSRQTEERLAQQKAAKYNLAYVNLINYPASLDILKHFSPDEIRQWGIVAYSGVKGKLKIGLVHPEDRRVITFLRQYGAKNKVSITPTVISQSSLTAMLDLYTALEEQKEQLVRQQAVAAKEAARHDYATLVKTLDDLKQYAQNINTSDLFDLILAAAINQNASDIHFEPAEDSYGIRFRIDGVLQPAVSLPASAIKPLVSRVKMHAGLKLDLGNRPQDGRFSMMIGSKPIDFRVSSLPSQYGESIVLRVLRQDIAQLNLDELGFNERDINLVKEAIHKPYGMILVTGPTGSGKTTTLYAILNELNTSEKKVITLEDPIEYRLPGIEQSQIETSEHYSFADALRASLRQDPDIIMIGEIRDEETARIALNASLTGHLVLSTVHANNAVMAMPRLVDMGIEAFFLSGSINLIVAQRLVRKTNQDPTTQTTQPYQGRLVIAEVLHPSADFERAVIKKEDYSTLLDVARQTGMTTMLDDGRAKAAVGLTTEEEVLRVTQENND